MEIDLLTYTMKGRDREERRRQIANTPAILLPNDAPDIPQIVLPPIIPVIPPFIQQFPLAFTI